MGTRTQRPHRALLWLLPGLLCGLPVLPLGFVAILVGSDEALAARQLQGAACGFAFAGLVLFALGAARVVYVYARNRAGPTR